MKYSMTWIMMVEWWVGFIFLTISCLFQIATISMYYFIVRTIINSLNSDSYRDNNKLKKEPHCQEACRKSIQVAEVEGRKTQRKKQKNSSVPHSLGTSPCRKALVQPRLLSHLPLPAQSQATWGPLAAGRWGKEVFLQLHTVFSFM